MAINTNEELLIVDDDNRPIGRAPRHIALKDYRTRVSHVWVINDKRELLCHLRSQRKDASAGLWDPCFGGHSAPGETELMTALNELREESGIVAVERDLQLWGKKIETSNGKFATVYLLHWNGEVSDLQLEAEEVDEAKWISVDEVLQKYQTGDTTFAVRGYEEELLRHLL